MHRFLHIMSIVVSRALAGAVVAGCFAVIAPASAAAESSTSPPQSVRATAVATTSIALRWRPVAGAVSYVVYRRGSAVGSTQRSTYLDSALHPARLYTYRVRARFPGGGTSAPSSMVPATTRAAASCDLYARPDGSDRASGSADHPFRTITHLVATLAPGQAGCLTGSFVEDATLRATGTAADPVVLRSVPGTRAAVRGRLWVPSASSHIVVQGLDLDGRNAAGLPSPTINGDHITFLRNDVTNRNTAICFLLGSIRGWGIASAVVLDSNRIHHCGVRPALNHHHGIYVENARSSWIVNNVIYANADRGVQLYPNSIGTTIARNVIDGNGQGVIFSGAEGYASSDNLVVENFLTNARIRYNLEHWWAESNPIGTGNRAVRNCLWRGRDGTMLTPTVGYVARGNAEADPKYRNRSAGDFRPTPGSACRYLLPSSLPLTRFG